MKSIRPVLVLCLLVASSVVPAGSAVVAAQQGETYAGTHVEFETTSDAVVDYSVNGETVLQSVEVQSQSAAERQGDVSGDVSLSAVTDLTAAPVSVDSRTEVSATVTAESGATMTAHDNSRGVLVVRSGGESQYVTADVSSSAETNSESDRRVVVTTADGTKGTFLVVGDGTVTVNEQGNVSAKLGSDGKLVFRSYPEGRDDADRKQERLITDGTAAAEVYVTEKTEQGNELAVDVVSYGEGTTVEVTERTEGAVTMTAERSRERGKVVITTVSEEVIGSAEDVQVTVDGEAAAKASSYSELRSAADGGQTSKFLVAQETSAEASADVLVAVNHFSERTITMERSDGSDGSETADGDDSDGSDGSGGDESTSSNAPGFGVGVALTALVAAALYAVRRD